MAMVITFAVYFHIVSAILLNLSADAVGISVFLLVSISMGDYQCVVDVDCICDDKIDECTSKMG